ncbi:hypothetical protein AAFM48_06805 [Burkholderia pseudomallei]
MKGIFVLIHRKPQPLLTITMFVTSNKIQNMDNARARAAAQKGAPPSSGLSEARIIDEPLNARHRTAVEHGRKRCFFTAARNFLALLLHGTKKGRPVFARTPLSFRR